MSACKTNKNHHHVGIFGENTELYFAIGSGIFFFTGIIIEKLTNLSSNFAVISFIISFFLGGFFIAIEAYEKIKNKQFEIDFLMIVAAIGAAYIDKWEEGALLLFLFSLGHALEEYAMGKAKKSIKALGELSPKTALVKRNNTTVEVLVENLQLNDIIVVKPNSKIAADGIIIKGNSSINQASITGESMPVDKKAIANIHQLPTFENADKENKVFTGTINGNNAIEVQVLRLSKDSTIARLIKLVSEAENQKSPTQLLTKKFEKWFVPTVIIFVFLLCFAHLIINETSEESLYRAITVLVAASPCALAISTPSAVLSGIARAAKGGVLIKGGRALENLGSLTTIAFDKTGTLTEGKPKLTNAIALNNFDKTEFLTIVLEVENLSNHPLAKAITKDITTKYNISVQNKASNIQAIQGKGTSAIYEKEEVLIGNEKLITNNQIVISESAKNKMDNLLQQGHTAMLVAYKKELIGLLSVMDTPREKAKSTLQKLKEMGIKKMVMLTGDHQIVGENVAQQIGLTQAKGNLLPEDKVTAIKELKQTNNEIAMVGDGVNDAPAMANSTVGIAMGAAGNDVALETADVALMSDKIEKLPFVIGLSRKSRAIIKQNLVISMGMILILVPLALFGIAKIDMAVVLHEGSTLLVIFNALRLLKYRNR